MSKLTSADRRKLVEVAELMIAHAPLIDYAETRPFPLYTEAELKQRFAKGEHTTWDCSGSCTEVFFAGDCKDPNGLGYDHEGYTGTELSDLPHYTDVSRGQAGALLVFGAGTGTHVCMVLEQDGDNPWLFSHGSEIGPLKIRLSDEKQAHLGQPITMLDVSHLGK